MGPPGREKRDIAHSCMIDGQKACSEAELHAANHGVVVAPRALSGGARRTRSQKSLPSSFLNRFRAGMSGSFLGRAAVVSEASMRALPNWRWLRLELRYAAWDLATPRRGE